MMTSFVEMVAGLLFPLQCAGCGQWDTGLCQRCWLLADADPSLGALDDRWGVPEVPLWVLGRYGGELRRIILAAKHEPGRNLDGFLFHAGCRLGEAVTPQVESAPGPIWVVPAPSSRRRRWDRQEVTGKLAHGVAEGIDGSIGVGGAQVVSALRLRPGAGSQSQRGQEARRRGRVGSMRVVEVPPPGAAVVLVDDVVSTGSTVIEMASCLGANVQVVAALARA